MPSEDEDPQGHLLAGAGMEKGPGPRGQGLGEAKQATLSISKPKAWWGHQGLWSLWGRQSHSTGLGAAG